MINISITIVFILRTCKLHTFCRPCVYVAGEAVAAYLWASVQPYMETTSTSSSSTSTPAVETEDPLTVVCTSIVEMRHCKRREDCKLHHCMRNIELNNKHASVWCISCVLFLLAQLYSVESMPSRCCLFCECMFHVCFISCPPLFLLLLGWFCSTRSLVFAYTSGRIDHHVGLRH